MKGWVCEGVGMYSAHSLQTWGLVGGRVLTPPVLISSGGHRSGRYASYWNAFLFLIILMIISWESLPVDEICCCAGSSLVGFDVY